MNGSLPQALHAGSSDADVLEYLRTSSVTPAMALLGCEALAVNKGAMSCKARFVADSKLCNGAGQIFGGQLCAMLDLVTSMALAATLRLTAGFVTLELKTSFLSGAKPGVIYGEAVVKRLGRKIAFLEGPEQRRRFADRARKCHSVDQPEDVIGHRREVMKRLFS